MAYVCLKFGSIRIRYEQVLLYVPFNFLWTLDFHVLISKKSNNPRYLCSCAWFFFCVSCMCLTHIVHWCCCCCFFFVVIFVFRILWCRWLILVLFISIVCIADFAVFAKRDFLMAKVREESKQNLEWNWVCCCCFFSLHYHCYFTKKKKKSTNETSIEWWKVFICGVRRFQLARNWFSLANQSAQRAHNSKHRLLEIYFISHHD